MGVPAGTPLPPVEALPSRSSSASPSTYSSVACAGTLIHSPRGAPRDAPASCASSTTASQGAPKAAGLDSPGSQMASLSSDRSAQPSATPRPGCEALAKPTM